MSPLRLERRANGWIVMSSAMSTVFAGPFATQRQAQLRLVQLLGSWNGHDALRHSRYVVNLPDKLVITMPALMQWLEQRDEEALVYWDRDVSELVARDSTDGFEWQVSLYYDGYGQRVYLRQDDGPKKLYIGDYACAVWSRKDECWRYASVGGLMAVNGKVPRYEIYDFARRYGGMPGDRL